jgi:DNA mismatch repair protein MutL
MRIQQLPITVANQIAAGEVIERPSSVVKELLENALDAQAGHISIDIGYGGLTQIKISDNGLGIIAEDLPLAIAAHATSKINQLKDLYSIASMGFRGEALASIASISRLAISSKPVEQPHAMMLTSVGGENIAISPCARAQGTTIDVRDIFFNTPVRKKFLKSERSEFQAIELIVKRFALSAPHIAMNLNHNDKLLLQLSAASCEKTRLARVRRILGKNFIEQSFYLDVQHAGLRLQGWISGENYQRSQSDQLWVYVNNRMVKDKLLNHAIKQVYEDILYPGRHPACLLYLSINPAEVDVNVHPTKHEVRFQQPRLIHDFISSQLQKVLQPKPQSFNYEQPPTLENTQLNLHEPSALSFQFLSKAQRPIAKENAQWIVLNSSFVLLFLNEQPYVVDGQYLQRKWLLSHLKLEALPLARRPLLVPTLYPVKQQDLEQYDAYYELVKQIGIELDLAGENSLIVRTVPSAVPHLDLKQFLGALFNGALGTTEHLLELLTACQKVNVEHLSQEEKELLIDYLYTLISDKAESWYKHLTLEACRELLNA